MVPLALGCGSRAAPEDGVSCWGNDFMGQLGSDDRNDSASPIRVPDTAAMRHLQLGNAVTCARGDTGPLRCWGSLEALGGAVAPPSIAELGDAIEIRTGSRFGCARHAAGDVVCWGNNLVGQLGNGGAPDQDTKVPINMDGTTTYDINIGASDKPVPVAGLADATQLAVAASRACALRKTGTVACWGMVGIDHTPTSPRPFEIPGVSGATAIAAGDNAACAVAGGAVWCWGSLIENGLPPHTWATATKIAGVDHAVEVAVAETEACARSEAGDVTCWRRQGAPFPRAVGRAVQLGAGFRHFCARTAAGTVACWGDNLNGQLGSDSIGAGGVVVPDVDHVVELGVGGSHTCVISVR
jgi:alpha-tubulin suppressor-like RCC1 family protein